MQKQLDFYTNSLKRYVEQCDKVRRQLALLSISRLLAFVIAVLVLYFLWGTIKLALALTFVTMALFLYLVKQHENTKTKYRYLHFLITINETEINALNHDVADLPKGEEYLDSEHHYSHDLDLFGEGSFFQFLNRTTLKEGSDRLAQLLTANDIESIESKQEAISELDKKADWRQNFTAQALFVEQHISINEVQRWLKAYTSFVPKSMRVLPWLFFGVFVLTVVFTIYTGMVVLPILCILLGLGITMLYFNKIAQLAQKADRVKSTFKQYHELLKIIEQTNFESPYIIAQKRKLENEGKNASAAIGGFSRLLDVMDYNNNVFYAIFGNGCFLGALHTAFRIENWIKQYEPYVGDWFEVIAFFEAYNSLGNFSFNHASYTYPIISKAPNVISCKNIRHPLIPLHKNIGNDFGITQKDFFIITGSNMAGKSTFLRSVGLCMVMSNLGLPINAEECTYTPKKLVTSMRSIDSLHKGDSYFLSELKRLKKVVQFVSDEDYFVLLDEILKGTNSLDKATGSKKFLARLIRENATGLIATHDLSLCESANEFSNVFNYHLDAKIENDELSFDYKLKEGVSKTMNASFLLKKMDLV